MKNLRKNAMQVETMLLIFVGINLADKNLYFAILTLIALVLHVFITAELE